MKKLIYILFILVISGLFCTFFSADVMAVQDTSPESGRIFRLPYKDTGFSYNVRISFEGKEIAFKKEPDFGEKDIVRGSIPAGREGKDHICFAWDSTDRTLYLDLNRNLDLTDDPSGVFKYDNKTYTFPQLFADIPIEFLHNSVRHHYQIDVRLYGSSRHPYGNVIVRSGWQGDIELYGKKWTLTVLDNMDGVIEEKDSFFLHPVREDGAQQNDMSFINMFSIQPELFFDGHGYDISYDIESGETETELKATFTETHPDCTQLTIDGQYIKRLILIENKNNRAPSVILDSPGTTVMIPARTYESQRVIVDSDDSLGFYYADFSKKLSVTGQGAVTLKAGAPLINSVKAIPNGRFLQLQYQLNGNGGELYRQVNTNFQKAPKYAIYHKDTMITSGSFRYG